MIVDEYAFRAFELQGFQRAPVDEASAMVLHARMRRAGQLR
ncbi:hypothetical protein ACH4TQ_50885 [Streptomyces sp. NPDC021218]